MSFPKPSEYPKEVRVLLNKYKLIFERSMHVDGECDTQNKEIFIDPLQAPRDMFATLIHEVLHAMEVEHKIKLKHSVVYKLEAAILLFLEDNFCQLKFSKPKLKKGSKLEV